MTAPATEPRTAPMLALRRPRLGFAGAGWIGRNRLDAIAASDAADIVMVADTVRANAEQATSAAPAASVGTSFSEILERDDLDGVVIATPSALHADQSIMALERGLAVFCQKPLARNAAETRRVITAARTADRLLGVDLSYRYTNAMQCVRECVQSGELGDIFAVDLVFHNAYGPDKPWFFDPALAGGGCVLDLGIHLVDLALWTLGNGEIASVSSRLFAQGRPLEDPERSVEDYAEARLDLGNGTAIRLSCSWNLHAGRDAIISAAFYGTRGGVALNNVNGSFFDFTAERFRGTRRELLSAPPDDWGGRAAVAWARQLARDASFDPGVESLLTVASALDAIYGR